MYRHFFGGFYFYVFLLGSGCFLIFRTDRRGVQRGSSHLFLLVTFGGRFLGGFWIREVRVLADVCVSLVHGLL